MEDEKESGFWFFLIVIGLAYFVFNGFSFDENHSGSYDSGYENGWASEDEPLCWTSQEEKDGYEDGADDAWYYDEGAYDRSVGKKPKYPDDPDYMDGYEA